MGVRGFALPGERWRDQGSAGYSPVVATRPAETPSLRWLMRRWELSGDLAVRCDGISPDEVTALVGIQPTKVIIAGTIPRPGAAPARATMWVLSKKLEETRVLGDALRAFLAELPAGADKNARK